MSFLDIWEYVLGYAWRVASQVQTDESNWTDVLFLPVASGKCPCSASGSSKRRENFSQAPLVGVCDVGHSAWTRQGYSVFLFYFYLINQMGQHYSLSYLHIAGGSVLLFYIVLSLIHLKILISALLAQKCFLPVCCSAVGCCCLPQRKLHFYVAMWI